MSSMKSHNITCKTCGRTNVPDWNGEGDCIRCARDKVLGPTDKNLDAFMSSNHELQLIKGVVEQSNLPDFAKEGVYRSIYLYGKQAQSDYLERVMPNRKTRKEEVV